MKDSNHQNLLTRRIAIAGTLTTLVMSQAVSANASTTKDNQLSKDEIRFLWNHRTKIISMLSVAGLTTAQLAPLRDAPRP